MFWVGGVEGPGFSRPRHEVTAKSFSTRLRRWSGRDSHVVEAHGGVGGGLFFLRVEARFLGGFAEDIPRCVGVRKGTQPWGRRNGRGPGRTGGTACLLGERGREGGAVEPIGRGQGPSRKEIAIDGDAVSLCALDHQGVQSVGVAQVG